MSFSVQQHKDAQELVIRAQQHLEDFRTLRETPSAPPNGQNDSIKEIQQAQLPISKNGELSAAEMRALMRARRAEHQNNPLPVSPASSATFHSQLQASYEGLDAAFNRLQKAQAALADNEKEIKELDDKLKSLDVLGELLLKPSSDRPSELSTADKLALMRARRAERKNNPLPVSPAK